MTNSTGCKYVQPSSFESRRALDVLSRRMLHTTYLFLPLSLDRPHGFTVHSPLALALDGSQGEKSRMKMKGEFQSRRARPYSRNYAEQQAWPDRAWAAG